MPIADCSTQAARVPIQDGISAVDNHVDGMRGNARRSVACEDIDCNALIVAISDIGSENAAPRNQRVTVPSKGYFFSTQSICD